MSGNGLFGNTINMIEQVLDLRARRHTLLSANIVNQDTPYYSAFDIAMEEELARIEGTGPADRQLDQTDRRHLSIAGKTASEKHYQLKELHPSLAKRDGNTVDIDRTMTDLAENTINYTALTRIMSKRLAGLKSAIKGGS